jgi:hypothetical protein
MRLARKEALALRALALALVGPALVFGAGCTFLISFDDVPLRDAGVVADAFVRPPPIDTGVVTPPKPDAAPTDPCDRTADLKRIQGCNQFVANGQACADNAAFDPYPFQSTVKRDVVTCNGGDAICLEHCTTACAHLPNGFPDECDMCTGKIDGDYCGSEMGWDARSYGLLVRCTSNVLATTPKPTACPDQCLAGDGKGTARCAP